MGSFSEVSLQVAFLSALQCFQNIIDQSLLNKGNNKITVTTGKLGKPQWP